MSKKYLSLDEAASTLGIPREELTRLRERGEIRGFADRGTWKFKFEDIQNLGRSRQADSDPDVPLILDEGSALSDDMSSSAEISQLGNSSALLGKDSSALLNRNELTSSDSDVRLIMDDTPEPAPPLKGMSDSDSDVKLVGEGSDSDVKLADDADSDSDVKLVGDETVRELQMPSASLEDSDSDVKLVNPKGPKAPVEPLDRTDSDVQLLNQPIRGEEASDSDVAILGSDSDIALDFGIDDGESASVFTDDGGVGPSGSGMLGAGSGISLSGPSDSGIALGADEDEGITLAPDKPDSGISLATGDSGISIAGPSDSGISLASADSGISLESVADSGISLEDSRDFGGTVPMMNAVREVEGPETKFEIPSLKSDDSAFELQSSKKTKKPGKPAAADLDETGVLDLGDTDEGSLDDAVFDIDEGEDSAEMEDVDDLEVADDVMDGDEELEELDVFDADDDAFAGSEEDEEMGSLVSRGAIPVEDEWSTGQVVLAGGSALASLLCCWVMFDLVRGMWLFGERSPEPGFLLKTFSGMF
jgi:excisionase family DNA binding protein